VLPPEVQRRDAQLLSKLSCERTLVAEIALLDGTNMSDSSQFMTA